MTLRNIDRYVRQMSDTLRALEVPAAVEDTFGQYRDYPAEFCGSVLGAQSAIRRGDGEPYQFGVLVDLAKNDRVSLRSGHGIGKSTINTWAALWWLLTRPMSRVVIVAPEFSRQVRAVLFAEIRKWARRSRVPLPVKVMASRAVVEGYGDEWGAMRSWSSQERF